MYPMLRRKKVLTHITTCTLISGVGLGEEEGQEEIKLFKRCCHIIFLMYKNVV